MDRNIITASPPQPSVSPMILSDRLITLAQAADRAGLTGTAGQLVSLACQVFDEAPRGQSPGSACNRW